VHEDKDALLVGKPFHKLAVVVKQSLAVLDGDSGSVEEGGFGFAQ